MGMGATPRGVSPRRRRRGIWRRGRPSGTSTLLPGAEPECDHGRGGRDHLSAAGAAAAGVKTYTARRGSRTTIWVDGERRSWPTRTCRRRSCRARGADHRERAMYLTLRGSSTGGARERGSDRAGAGVVSGGGATGAYFDLYYLLCNPNAQPAQVTITYMRSTRRRLRRPIRSRPTAGRRCSSTGDSRLSDDAVSARVSATNGCRSSWSGRCGGRGRRPRRGRKRTTARG